MADMTFDEFKQEIADNIKEYLPDKYADSTVQVNAVQKNNETLDALTVTSPDSNMSPTIYLNSYYEDYQNGRDMDDILDSIADLRVEHEVNQDFDVSSITDFEKVSDKIAARLYGMEGNEELLSARPHATMDDLAVTYCIMLGDNENGSMSVPITNQIMETWGVTQEDLRRIAQENCDTLTPSKFMSMNAVMTDMMVPQIMSDYGVDREEAIKMVNDMVPTDDKLFVLTNNQKLNGAAALLDEKMMEQIAERVGNDFYILPSSVHEVLIVPKEAGMDLKDLEAMVQEVNATQVAPEDKLTDSVYHYDAEAKIFELGEKFVNREQAKEAEKEAKSEEKGSVLSDLEAKKEEVAKQPKKEAIDKGAKSKGETSL